MSNDLERAFASLSADADRAQLAPARAVRRRGDRQTLSRAVAGAAAVIVLVTGVTVGARMVLAGPDRDEPPPVPAASPTLTSPSPSPSPSAVAPARSTPSTTSKSSPPPETPETPEIPSSIPARAFLQASDAPGEGGTPERQGAGDHDLPEFCGNGYEQRGDLGIRATQLMYYRSADAPPDSTPKSAVFEDIMVFRGDGAEQFMDDLRAAVRDCPSPKNDKNVSRGPLGAGDESLLIERNHPAMTDEGVPAGDGSLHRVYFSAIRVGDAVAVVSDTGWESGSADRADTEHLAARAAIRLENWRK
ncbi:hypothetical protein [Actinoplanes sp. NPDC089786]|uniref:hypothetical protein n=1 Tax=Actinoplanes sp. NPDC089786 TaxID=3155185 RepID=UPI003419BBB2